MNPEDAEKRRQELQHSIEERNKQRIAEAKEKRARNVSSVPYEAIEAFNQEFQDFVSQIDVILTSSDCATPESIDSMLELLLNARNLLSQSTSFLPNYDVDHSQARIEELQDKIQQKRSGATQKKFSFRSAKKKAAVKPVNSLAPTAGTHDPPPTPHSDSDDFDPLRTLQGISNQEVVLGTETLGESTGDFSLSKLENCTIHVSRVTTALRLSKLRNCCIYAAPVSGSIFVQDCSELTVYTASRQIRIHETTNSQFYLYTQSRPTIENCSGMKFGPYLLDHDLMNIWLSECHFDLERNEWENVQDFNWLKSNSPNWSVIPVDERKHIQLVSKD